MQTIQLQIEDNLYKNVLGSGIDLQARFQEFLADLVDDGYPSISTHEAKKRVAEAVNDYKNNRDTSFAILDDKFWEGINNRIDGTVR